MIGNGIVGYLIRVLWSSSKSKIVVVYFTVYFIGKCYRGQMKEFQSLPDDSKCWLFGFKTKASDQQVKTVASQISPFLSSWLSHGKEITSSYDILENQFLLIAAHGSSGCSIDSMRKEVSKILSDNNLELSDFTDVFWRAEGNLHCSSRDEFATLVKESDTKKIESVYDLSISVLGDLKSDGMSKQYESSWAAKAFA